MKAIPKVEPETLERKDLLHRFGEEFSFTIAKTPRQLQDVFALRHDVFIKEIGYDMEEDESHSLERDEHDSRAIHCFIRHKRTGLIAGCLRLIAPGEIDSNHGELLPIEAHGDGILNHDTFRPDILPRNQICEVSRLAIAKPFRERPKDDTSQTSNIFTLEERKVFPIILIGLFLCTYTLVGLTGKRHVFAMMEPKLPRLLSYSGFHFSKVSGDIFYHGKRNAFYIDHQVAEQQVHQDLTQLYAAIQKELSPQLDVTNAFKTAIVQPEMT